MSNSNASRSGSEVVQNISSLPGIARLTGRENWPTWKFAVQTLLELEDLWCAVKPERNDDGTYKAVDAAVNRRARAKIILLLDPVNYVHVKEAQTAKDVWMKLESAFEDNGLTRRVGLLHKLVKTELTACMSMDDYVNRIVSAAHQLNGINFPIPDEWVGTLLLAGLPEEYRPMIMALENSGIAITGDAIKTKLLQEVKFSTEDTAFAANRRSGTAGGHGKFKPKTEPRSDPPKGPKCRKCHKFGHIARDCRSARKEEAFCAVLTTFSSTKKTDWVIDSGASVHMTSHRELLEEVKPSTGAVVAANGNSMNMVGIGSTILRPVCQENTIQVHEVQLIPDLSVNLLSVNQIVKKGYTVVFTDAGCKVINRSGDTVATGKHENDLFQLEQHPQDTSNAMACSSAVSLKTWHQRLGHLNMRSIRKLANGLVDGITIVDTKAGDCKVCAMGKHCRQPFSKQGSRAADVLDVVHTDICGPMEQKSLGGSRYYIVFVDDKSRKMWTYFLKTKSEQEVLRTFKEFHTMVERQSERKLKVLRSDNGKEYVNKGFENYLKQNGIQHQKTTAYTPEQNGMAERANRSIVERARCLLFEAGLAKTFWAEAVHTSVYLLNRSPTQGHDSTPEQVWTGKKPDLAHLRVFGSKAMVQTPKQRRKKLDPKSRECIFVGYDDDTKGYRLYDTKLRKVIISREVSFIDEGMASSPIDVQERNMVPLDFKFMMMSPAVTAPAKENMEHSDDDEEDEFYTDCENGSINIEEECNSFNLSQATVTNMTPVLPLRKSSYPPWSQVLRRSGREHKLPGKYNEFEVSIRGLPQSKILQVEPIENADDVQEDVPMEPENQEQFSGVATAIDQVIARSPLVDEDPWTHQEALSREDAERWKQAMCEEFSALMANDTWTLTELPDGRKPIKCKWVFKTKYDANGNVDRHKARLVVKGYSQRKGVDYDETYSPVVRHSSLRFLFALSAKHGFSIDQMDATTAFLQGELSEEIYMEQPPCFQSSDKRQLVCRLNKALYGLKQSSRVWNSKLDAALRSFGMIPSNYDPCLYYRIEGTQLLFIAIYVDDVLIFSSDGALTSEIKKKLSNTFRMKDLGKASSCLGIRIMRGRDTVSLDQEAYIESVLSRFSMQNAKSASTPMNSSLKLTKDMAPQTADVIESMKRVPYQEAVGSLMYLAQCTRPDILFAVNQLSRFNTNPGQEHWEAVKHLLRYLRGTSKLKLRYTKQGDSALTGYSDANWASDLDDRKSISGYIFMLQGAAVSWCCKRQPTVALSTCEAEYMALSATVQEAMWWRGLMSQLGCKQPIELRCDNQSAICIAKNGGYTPRTKHIDIRHHFIRDALDKNIVQLQYVGTDQQIADGLTKSLERIKLERNRTAMGIKASA